MKKVTVFIASALESLKNERKDLSDYLYSLNDVFSEYIGNQYEIRPFLSEHFDPRYNGKRTQDALNKELINSELVVFLVNSGTGEGTKEEYDIAKKHFAETRKPAIYIFFMEPTDIGTTSATFTAIKNDLMHEGHYWESFKHIDTVKLRITLSLNAIIHTLPQISMDAGYLTVDDIQLMSLENVSEFANNTMLQHLAQEMRQIEEKHIQIKRGYLSGAMPAYEEEYRALSVQKEKLSKMIADLQKNIFEISINICRDAVHGTITARQKEAYRVFELGDYEGCLSILSEEEIDTDFQSTQERLDEMQRDNARRYIREQTMAIKILYLMQDDSDRFAKIESRFAKAIKVAQRYRVDAFVIYYYASFLFSLRRYQDSLEALEKLRSHYLNCKETEQAGIWRIGKLYNLSGALYYLLRNHEDSAENYKKVYEIGLEIESRSEDSERSPGSGLGRVENNLALLKIAYGDTASAEMLLRSSLIRFDRMVKISRKEYLRDYGEVMKN